MSKLKVLVFPCGSEIGLEINNSLRFCKDISLYGASSVNDHGKYVYNNYISDFPHIDSTDFISFLNEAIFEYEIDFIMPAHDSVVLKLSQFANEVKCRVITSSYETNEICRDKLKTYMFFDKYDFIPVVYKEFNTIEDFPVFLKPRVGQGSKGAVKINNVTDLSFYKPFSDESLVLEYLPGDEYTVDCFTNRNRELKFIGQRKRNRIKDGISVNTSYCVLDEQVSKMATIFNSELVFRGVWFFQVKIDSKGRYKLLEISSRVAGCMGLARNHGVNLPLLSIYDCCDIDVNIDFEKYNLIMDRAFISRYSRDFDFEAVYVDFDDTIIIKDKVNTMLLMFLYKCVNSGKRIILLTRHEKNIMESLNSAKISPDIFDEIITVTKNVGKSNYIANSEKTIFIDDSFSERCEAKSICGNIHVFSPESIECLIDWTQQ